MQGLEEFQLTLTSPIVNVASVRQISPFRYPGGKTWLVPKVLTTLRSLRKKHTFIVDPFLGGGSVPLAALVEGLVEEAVLCERDDNVAAVWQTIFSTDYETLCQKISSFRIDRAGVIELLSRPAASTLERAFHAIVKNRTFRGGILASGASLVKAGENGRGVASRWYPETLIRRIKFLHQYSPRVKFIHGDGMELLEEYSSMNNTFIFVDPPYTAGSGKRAGSRLYEHSVIDHESLFDILERGCADFMMTYDDDLDVLNLARRNGFVLQYMAMKNTHHRQLNELLITRT